MSFKISYTNHSLNFHCTQDGQQNCVGHRIECMFLDKYTHTCILYISFFVDIVLVIYKDTTDVYNIFSDAY